MGDEGGGLVAGDAAGDRDVMMRTKEGPTQKSISNPNESNQTDCVAWIDLSILVSSSQSEPGTGHTQKDTRTPCWRSFGSHLSFHGTRCATKKPPEHYSYLMPAMDGCLYRLLRSQLIPSLTWKPPSRRSEAACCVGAVGASPREGRGAGLRPVHGPVLYLDDRIECEAHSFQHRSRDLDLHKN